MADRPNVLFLLSDQHSAKFLGCVGHRDVRTPNLDRLGGEGVRFDNAIAQNPICTPSRVSWLSGQYCHNHGYYSNSGPNPGGLPTILGHFRRRASPPGDGDADARGSAELAAGYDAAAHRASVRAFRHAAGR